MSMNEDKPILVALELTKSLIAQHKITNWQAAWQAYLGLVEGISTEYTYDYEEPFELTRSLIDAGHLDGWQDVCTAYTETTRRFHEWRTSENSVSRLSS